MFVFLDLAHRNPHADPTLLILALKIQKRVKIRFSLCHNKFSRGSNDVETKCKEFVGFSCVSCSIFVSFPPISGFLKSVYNLHPLLLLGFLFPKVQVKNLI